uniref:Uncharacterized protein n=1 Tax=Arundo donax TaxID=35708 RepID=A0A0A9GQQ5_ARUDO
MHNHQPWASSNRDLVKGFRKIWVLSSISLSVSSYFCLFHHISISLGYLTDLT